MSEIKWKYIHPMPVSLWWACFPLKVCVVLIMLLLWWIGAKDTLNKCCDLMDVIWCEEGKWVEIPTKTL